MALPAGRGRDKSLLRPPAQNPGVRHYRTGLLSWVVTARRWELTVAEGNAARFAGTLNGQTALVSASYGRGKALVSATPFNLFVDKGETLTAAQAGYAYAETVERSGVVELTGAEEMTGVLYQIITDAIRIPTASSRKHSLELVVREGRDGKRYLFAINPSLREAVTDDIILNGRYAKVVDLGLGNVPTPTKAEAQKVSTAFAVRLEPGEGTCFELIKK